MAVVPPTPLSAIVTKLGIMSQPFQAWANLVSKSVPSSGTGTPEGVIEATKGEFYVDDAGIAGAILYVKQVADVSGDKSKGWILT